MMNSIRDALESGMPCLAECGDSCTFTEKWRIWTVGFIAA